MTLLVNSAFWVFVVVQAERQRYAREKKLKEEALREKEELERRLAAMHEEIKQAQDQLVGHKVVLQ